MRLETAELKKSMQKLEERNQKLLEKDVEKESAELSWKKEITSRLVNTIEMYKKSDQDIKFLIASHQHTQSTLKDLLKQMKLVVQQPKDTNIQPQTNRISQPTYILPRQHGAEMIWLPTQCSCRTSQTPDVYGEPEDS